ncbi:hypothetical protein Mgra_00003426 [Meloidogyne graminicola]|uniref:Uncharacterized protein n=1 Tax=Meloidogyne graminicola TaxID=189291 RepID=A0A8S9ZV49_9BILA|nr:hypothetical protein Mgra_00003426 [Meloidogyne graminicola]
MFSFVKQTNFYLAIFAIFFIFAFIGVEQIEAGPDCVSPTGGMAIPGSDCSFDDQCCSNQCIITIIEGFINK